MDFDKAIRQHKINKYIEAYREMYLREPDAFDLMLERAMDKDLEKGAMRATTSSVGIGTGTGPGRKEFPVNTISNGRKKISSNPSRWVDLSTGRSHDDHDTKEHHTLDHYPQVKKVKDKIMSGIKDKIDPRLHEHAESLLNGFLQEKVHAKNMMHASKGEDPSIFKQGHKVADSANQKKQELIGFLKKAHTATRNSKKRSTTNV